MIETSAYLLKGVSFGVVCNVALLWQQINTRTCLLLTMMFKQVQGLSCLKQNFTQSFILLKITFLELDYFNELSPFSYLLTYSKSGFQVFHSMKTALTKVTNELISLMNDI